MVKSFFFKILFFSLVSVYVFTTVGVNVIAHYCCGELEKISLFSKPSSCCEGENTEATDGCCANDVKYVSFQSDFTFNTLINTCKALEKDLFLTPTSLISFGNEINFYSAFVYNTKIHPPNLAQQHIISSSVIRI